MARVRQKKTLLCVQTRLQIVALSDIEGCHPAARYAESVLAEVPYLVREMPAVDPAALPWSLLASPLLLTPKNDSKFEIIANFRSLQLLVASGAETANAVILENCDDALVGTIACDTLILSPVLAALGNAPHLMLELKQLIERAQSNLVPIDTLPKLKRRRHARKLPASLNDGGAAVSDSSSA